MATISGKLCCYVVCVCFLGDCLFLALLKGPLGIFFLGLLKQMEKSFVCGTGRQKPSVGAAGSTFSTKIFRMLSLVPIYIGSLVAGNFSEDDRLFKCCSKVVVYLCWSFDSGESEALVGS